MKTIITLLILSLFTSSSFAAPAKVPTMKICIAANGSLSAKTKCSKTETTASSSSFQSVGAQGSIGPQGPQGPVGPSGVLNISSCRSFQNSQFTTNGTIVLTSSCNANEFLLNYGNYTIPQFNLQFLRSTEVLYSNGIPYGVTVVAQTEVGTTPDYNVFSFLVTTTCCPRQ